MAEPLLGVNKTGLKVNQPDSEGFFTSIIKKFRPSSKSKASETSTVGAKQKPIIVTNATLNSEAGKPIVSKPNQVVSTSSANSGGGQKMTWTSGPTTNRKIVVNAGQKVIRLDNNLYLIKNPMAAAKGSGTIQKQAQKNFIIAKCTCKQRLI